MIEIIQEDEVRKKTSEYIKFNRPSSKEDWLETLNDTKERRKTQICRTYETKLDISHLNKDTTNQLNVMFLEGKWLSNYAKSQDNVFEVDYKIKKVPVKVMNTFEERKIDYLSSQMRQALIERIIDDVKGLSATKEKGRKVGKLKFKSDPRSIPLKQYGKTYKILNNKYITIQGIKQRIRVNGLEQILDQIKDGIEIADATFIKRQEDYYIHITTYIDKDIYTKIEQEKYGPIPTGHTGIDFGILRQLTLSNGITVEYEAPITERLRRLAQSMSRKVLHSKNWNKARNKLTKEYEKLNNIKRDTKNKIIRCLRNNFKIVSYQNDPISGWQRIYGRKILSTGIGEIKSMLEKKIQTPVEVNRWYPSTKTCCKCGNKYNIKRSERIYSCKNEKCGNIMDRDFNSAICIDDEGLRLIGIKVGTERIEFKPEEIRTNTFILEYLNNIPYVTAEMLSKASLIVDAGSSLL